MDKFDKILDQEITSFLMDNAESMQKVLIQEIRDKFIEKVDDKIVWKQGFRVRMQEIDEIKEYFEKQINELVLVLKQNEEDNTIARSYIVEKLNMILNGGIGFHSSIEEKLNG